MLFAFIGLTLQRYKKKSYLPIIQYKEDFEDYEPLFTFYDNSKNKLLFLAKRFIDKIFCFSYFPDNFYMIEMKQVIKLNGNIYHICLAPPREYIDGDANEIAKFVILELSLIYIY